MMHRCENDKLWTSGITWIKFTCWAVTKFASLKCCVYLDIFILSNHISAFANVGRSWLLSIMPAMLPASPIPPALFMPKLPIQTCCSLSGEFRTCNNVNGWRAKLSSVVTMLENDGRCVRCFCQQSSISWYSASGQSIGAGSRYPFSILFITSWFDQFQYGRSPYDITSHNTTPYDHTSDADVNFRNAIASGAVHRTGIFPPYTRFKNINWNRLPLLAPNLNNTYSRCVCIARIFDFPR